MTKQCAECRFWSKLYYHSPAPDEELMGRCRHPETELKQRRGNEGCGRWEKRRVVE
jgi:hypothetical protein